MIYHDSSTDKHWTIPAGIPVSMDATSINLNSKVYPEPLVFKPERWIENPRIDKYLLSFSKGSRMCVG